MVTKRFCERNNKIPPPKQYPASTLENEVRCTTVRDWFFFWKVLLSKILASHKYKVSKERVMILACASATDYHLTMIGKVENPRALKGLSIESRKLNIKNVMFIITKAWNDTDTSKLEQTFNQPTDVK